MIVFASWLTCLSLCGVVEWQRLTAAASSPAGILAWFADWNAETTLPGFVLVSVLFLIVFQRSEASRVRSQRRGSSPSSGDPAAASMQSSGVRHTCALLLAVLSLLSSYAVGSREITYAGVSQEHKTPFFQLPHAYHDEFSYRLQAETFAAGRWTFPGAPVAPDLFHQFHVLNEPVTSSRYFPWTGLWISPFLQTGSAIFGHWLAGAIATGLFFLVLSRHLPLGWAIAGGALIAVSPGIAVFSNLLLSHHPTLMALALFLWAFDSLLRTNARRYALLSGLGLSAAMLGRPMTAAGFALPFGCWLVVRWWKDRGGKLDSESQTMSIGTRSLVLMGVPLVLGFLILGVQNHQVTGTWHRSPYQAYTDQFTPSHRYGFDNADASQLVDVPESIRAYDAWATNLTPSVAANNVGQRVLASVQWTLGIIPLCCGGILSVLCLFDRNQRKFVGLLWASLLSLHLVHVPYWYDGIMHWHYVFESAPYLIMIAVCGWREGARWLTRFVTPRSARLWFAALIFASLAPGWIGADFAWGTSKVGMAVSEQAFSRVRFAQFQELIRSDGVQKPALILVDESGSDPQLSYIVNPPDLSDEVLVCRATDDPEKLDELRRYYGGRAWYVFDPLERRLTEYDSGFQGKGNLPD